MHLNHVTPDTTLARAHLLIRREGVRCLAVVENENIVGIISDEDIRKVIDSKSQMGSIPLLVGNFMTAPVKVIECDGPTELANLLKSLLEETDARAFVMTKDGVSQDILSRTDLLDRVCGNGVQNSPWLAARKV